MNWMDFTKNADFWKAWQDAVKPAFGQGNRLDPMQSLWQQQEQFWKSAMEQSARVFSGQPDLSQQWQEMQQSFMKQWTELMRTATDRQQTGTGAEDVAQYWKRFADQSEQWFAEAFRDKLPEALRPHFQTYLQMYQLFSGQWENMQAMIRSGLVDPRQVWQWINPAQYGDAVGRVMGFKPMGDLDEITRQANHYFDQMRSMIMKMIPAAEERMMAMGESMQKWSNQQAHDVFPFLHGMQEMMKQSLEPYFHAAGQDTQAEVLRQMKDLHFSYLAYLHHSHRMQRMVMDAGAKVLPEMMQEARTQYADKQEMPVFDTFFRHYMDRLEEAIVAVMHTPEYTEVQNQTMKAGTTAKRIYDDMMQVVLKDSPFLTKKDADDLAAEATALKRRVRQLEAQMKQMSAPTPAAAPAAAKTEAPRGRKPSTTKKTTA